MSEPYNILSLDGGGSWALIQVKCLQRLFGDEATGHSILRHFQLVAANSGGSIVLAGLVADLPLSAILQIFRTEHIRRDIFSPTDQGFWHWWHELVARFKWDKLNVGPRYSTPHKLEALDTQLDRIEAQYRAVSRPAGGVSALCLDDVPTYVGGTADKGPHVLITTFDYNRQRSTFFRSDRTSLGDSAVLQRAIDPATPASPKHKGIRLLEAVHASSTAPVNFFDAPARISLNGQVNHLWDGGVAGYNNPVLAAVTEALTNNVPAADVRVLSIGTGTQVFPVRLPGQAKPEFAALVTEPVAEAGFLADIRKLASSILSAPPDAASFVAFTALNPGFVQNGCKNVNFVRANPSVQPLWNGTRWTAPVGFDEPAIKAIQQIELDAITDESVDLIVNICNAWLNNTLPNQPIRASATLECLVGQPDFTAVQQQFKLVFPNIPAQLP
ncbi:patatin-like phospholipase family protein [Hymenobacter rubidus]|uniref:patatin-like phospholipase family protein n=1 Tax=Hymenobacter rubidus TaxID=1441626 RepID=UPI00191D2990|nr:patatin-like phospholipase family protein [Hymenobacter rubidus]